MFREAIQQPAVGRGQPMTKLYQPKRTTQTSKAVELPEQLFPEEPYFRYHQFQSRFNRDEILRLSPSNYLSPGRKEKLVININDDGILLENIDANKVDVQVIDARSSSGRRQRQKQAKSEAPIIQSPFHLWQQHKQLERL